MLNVQSPMKRDLYFCEQVEILQGSGVLCNPIAWATAANVTSATSFARALLMGTFDVSTLMDSSLKGGSSKRGSGVPAKQPLDPAKLDAIYSKLCLMHDFWISYFVTRYVYGF